MILGIDVSTSVLGYTLLSNEGTLIEINYLVLPKTNLIIKAEEVRKLLRRLNQIHHDSNINKVYIEEALNNTPININTTSILLQFNGMVQYVVYEVLNVMPVMVKAYDARKLYCPELVHSHTKKTGEVKETLSFPAQYRKNKKQYIWEKVSKELEQYNITWELNRNKHLKPQNYDMSDSYIIARYHFLY